MTAPVQQYVAHYRKTGEIQSLETHLLESSLLASTFARKLGLHEAGELIGLLHDLGKYSDEFQRYLRSAVGISEQDPDEDNEITTSQTCQSGSLTIFTLSDGRQG